MNDDATALDPEADDLLGLADQLRTPLVILCHLLRREAMRSDLTMPQSAVLGRLVATPRRATELAAMEGVRPSTMTDILTRMEAQGWVTSGRNIKDGRVREVAITDEGREILHRAIKERNLILVSRLRDLNRTSVEALRAAVVPLQSIAGIEPDVVSALRGLTHP